MNPCGTGTLWLRCTQSLPRLACGPTGPSTASSFQSSQRMLGRRSNAEWKACPLIFRWLHVPESVSGKCCRVASTGSVQIPAHASWRVQLPAHASWRVLPRNSDQEARLAEAGTQTHEPAGALRGRPGGQQRDCAQEESSSARWAGGGQVSCTEGPCQVRGQPSRPRAWRAVPGLVWAEPSPVWHKCGISKARKKSARGGVFPS